ncbi:hypothetical protein HNR44_003586, partial [Geomicrobium halophilum]
MKIINLETMSPLVLFFSLLLIVSSWEGVAAAQEKNDFDEPPITGFEDRDGEEWTTHEEELEFLEEVEEKSERMTYSEVGTSVEGRPLHLVQVGGPSPATDEEMADGQNMLIIGSQHGNEPAPREMALQLLRDLAFTEDPEREGQLEELTVMFIPTANPDGREADTRTNAEGVDINREHLNLGTPEIQVIGEVLNQYNPDITIDAHERPSADGNPDMEMQWPRNLNVDDELRELNEEMVEDYLRPNVEEAGFTTGLYGDASEPTLGLETVLSQMAGLRHGLGLLTESSGQQDPKYRVEAQMETVESTLEFYRERMDDVTTVVSEAPSRKMEEGADRSEPFYLDGADIREPEDSDVLDPHPCGYLLHSSQANEVSLHIDSFSLETEEVGENGVFVSMSQPMMTVVPFLLDGEASYNEVEGLALEDCSDPRITASGLQTLVEQLDEAGEFENSDAPYALDVHLRAVSHYEDQEETDKVVEHMGGFHNLLIQQLENDWISEDAFHMLETFADDLIENYGETFDVDRVMDHISHLSEDIGPRVAGSEEELEAAEYIEDEFDSLGYDTSMQTFDIRG